MRLVQLLSQSLLVPEAHIKRIAAGASHHYKAFTVPKRNGGVRTIHHPSKVLKAIQRCLLDRLIAELPVHECATAYRRGLRSGIVRTAIAHQSSSFTLRMDFADFFPSIFDTDIRTFLDRQSLPIIGIAIDEDVDLFCQLVCRAGRLTIGAPSSPGLSNAICLSMDRALGAVAVAHGAAYTRYADDLFFSTTTKGILRTLQKDVEQCIAKLTCPASLQINTAKTKHLSKRGRRVVTGVVLTSSGDISVGRSLKRSIRALIHKYDSLDSIERRRLAGLLAHCSDVEPDLINRLILKYGPERIRKAKAGALPGGPRQ